MNTLKKSTVFSMVCIFLSGCAGDNFKATVPADHKDEARYGFGSVLRGKDSPMKNLFASKETCRTEEKVSGGEINVEKPTGKRTKKDVLWDASISVLSDFPIEFMDKKTWKIETDSVKVNQFDETGECFYKIIVTFPSDKDVAVVVYSTQDSAVRLKKHAEVITNKILERFSILK